eukprot:scaffold6352_cov67-Phaeocystis_antarctica.AAC.8
MSVDLPASTWPMTTMLSCSLGGGASAGGSGAAGAAADGAAAAAGPPPLASLAALPRARRPAAAGGAALGGGAAAAGCGTDDDDGGASDSFCPASRASCAPASPVGCRRGAARAHSAVPPYSATNSALVYSAPSLGSHRRSSSSSSSGCVTCRAARAHSAVPPYSWTNSAMVPGGPTPAGGAVWLVSSASIASSTLPECRVAAAYISAAEYCSPSTDAIAPTHSFTAAGGAVEDGAGAGAGADGAGAGLALAVGAHSSSAQ